MPQCIFVKFENAPWRIGDLEPGVFPLTPKVRVWSVNELLKVKARRYGFTLLPDLAGTAHMYQGAGSPHVHLFTSAQQDHQHGAKSGTAGMPRQDIR
jgi:hypothetical protein